MAASVTTALRVSSWKAKVGFSIFWRSSERESAINTSEMGKPFCARSSSSSEAVCRETWKSAGSARARGHQETTKGLESILMSSG